MLLQPLSHIALLFASCMVAQPALQAAGSIIIPPEGDIIIPPDGDVIMPPEGIEEGACMGGGVVGGGVVGGGVVGGGGGTSCAIK